MRAVKLRYRCDAHVKSQYLLCTCAFEITAAVLRKRAGNYGTGVMHIRRGKIRYPRRGRRFVNTVIPYFPRRSGVGETGEVLCACCACTSAKITREGTPNWAAPAPLGSPSAAQPGGVPAQICPNFSLDPSAIRYPPTVSINTPPKIPNPPGMKPEIFFGGEDKGQIGHGDNRVEDTTRTWSFHPVAKTSGIQLVRRGQVRSRCETNHKTLLFPFQPQHNP